MGRAPCCSKEGLKRGPWTTEEDALLTKYIEKHGEGNWRSLPKAAGLWRCGKSCRLRWINYLRPDLKRGNISEDEEELIMKLHTLLGNRWSLIAGRIPGRTDNEIKNYWNTHLRKKLANKANDPRIKRPLHPGSFNIGPPQIINSARSDGEDHSSPECWRSSGNKLPELQTDVSHGNTGAESDVSSQGINNSQVEQAAAGAASQSLSPKRASASNISQLKTDADLVETSRSKKMNHVDTITSHSTSSGVSPSFSAISVSGDDDQATSPSKSDPCSLETATAPSASTQGHSDHELHSGISVPPTTITSSFEATYLPSPYGDVPISVCLCSNDNYNNHYDISSSCSSECARMALSFDYGAADINSIIMDFLPAANYEPSFLEQLQSLDFLEAEAETEINDNFWESTSWPVSADSWGLF